MQQLSFGDAEYHDKKKLTRREKFLHQMEAVVPWKRLEALIEAAYPKQGGKGRPPYPLNTMLRIYFMQSWFGFSDPAMEDAIYEITAVRQFARLSLNQGGIPDETTILKFRHLLEEHELGKAIFDEVAQHLTEAGLLLRQGSIVDATIINAPTSTKNKNKSRDPEMHQTKKGNEWRFGMKAHTGVDESSGLVHSLSTTAANHHDVTELHNLLHGEEQRVFGDSGYLGAQKRPENQQLQVDWHIALRIGQRRKLGDDAQGKLQRAIEETKASIRAKVEHPYRILKQQFGYCKTRYRGLAKNTNHLHTLFALGNLYAARRALAA